MRCITLIFTMLALCCLPSLSVRAETSVAVVDVKMLMERSLAAQSIVTQIKQHKDSFLSGLNTEEKQLREIEKKLATAKDKIPQDEFTKQAREFEARLIESRRVAQNNKRSLDEAETQAYETLRQDIYKVVQAIADEKGYQLVISREEVVIGAESLDISALALERLNAETPGIKLQLPDAPAPPAQQKVP